MASDRNRNNDQIEKTAEAGRNAARAGEQTVRATADAARRGAGTAQEASQAAWQSGLNTTAQGLQTITDRFTQALGFAGPQAEELARRASENIQAVSQASSVLAKSAQEISQEWLNLAQDRFAKNLEALNRLTGCRSVQDFVAVQSEIMRDRLGDTVESSRRLAEVSTRVANEAARVMQTEADRNAVTFERNADRARRAA